MSCRGLCSGGGGGNFGSQGQSFLPTVEKILEEYLQGSVPEPLVCEDISRFLMALWRQDPKGADVRGQIEEVEAKLIETKMKTATPEEHPHQLLLRAEREKDRAEFTVGSKSKVIAANGAFTRQ